MINGDNIFLINEDPKARDDASFMDLIFRDPPIPINASGRAVSAIKFPVIPIVECNPIPDKEYKMAKYRYIGKFPTEYFTVGKLYEVDKYNSIIADDEGDARTFDPDNYPADFELVTETGLEQGTDMGEEDITQDIFNLIEHGSNTDIIIPNDLYSPTSFKVFNKNDGRVYTVTITQGV